MLKKRFVFGGLLVILVAPLSAGCGGDETLTKAEYVAKLNAMCKDFAAREKEIGEPQGLADLVENGDRIADAFEQAIANKVDDLKPPDEISDEADRLVDIAQRQRDVLRGLAAAAKANDFERLERLVARNQALNEEAESIMRELGAEECIDD